MIKRARAIFKGKQVLAENLKPCSGVVRGV
jgi:hypothetical protein